MKARTEHSAFRVYG